MIWNFGTRFQISDYLLEVYPITIARCFCKGRKNLRYSIGNNVVPDSQKCFTKQSVRVFSMKTKLKPLTTIASDKQLVDYPKPMTLSDVAHNAITAR